MYIYYTVYIFFKISSKVHIYILHTYFIIMFTYLFNDLPLRDYETELILFHKIIMVLLLVGYQLLLKINPS
jgi:hypothetical protein